MKRYSLLTLDLVALVAFAVLTTAAPAPGQEFGTEVTLYSQASPTASQMYDGGKKQFPGVGLNTSCIVVSTPSTSVIWGVSGTPSPLGTWATTSALVTIQAYTACAATPCYTQKLDTAIRFLHALITSSTNSAAVVQVNCTQLPNR